MPNASAYPGLDRIDDPKVREALRLLWQALYVSKNQTNAAFALVSPANASAVKSLLGLQ